MVDANVTPAEVLPGADTSYVKGTLGETVTAGQCVYLDSTTATYKKADIDASADAANAIGIAMNGGSSGQFVKIATGGHIDPGFTVILGEIYVVSGTAGGIAPVADLAQNDYTHILGLGISASSMKLAQVDSGVLHA